MAALDLHTTIFVSATTLLLIGIVLLLYGAGGTLRWAPVAWGLGNVAHAVAMLLTLAQGYGSRPVLILANLVELGALALLWSGTAYFMGVRRPVWLLIFPSLVVLITFPVFIYVIPSQLARIVLGSTLAAVGCCDSGRLLLGGQHAPTRVLGWVLIGAGLGSGLRALGGVAAVLFAEPFTSLVQVEVNALASLSLFILWSVGMLTHGSANSTVEPSVFAATAGRGSEPPRTAR